MDKIYEDAKDLHVKSIYFYGKKSDHKLYYEPDFKKQVTKSDAGEFFKKGLLIIVNGETLLMPISMTGNKVYTIDKTGEPTDEFSETETYSVGDVVIYSGKSYKCKTAISTAGAWDASKWDEITTVDFVEWSAKN